jgi:hypothetical protein
MMTLVGRDGLMAIQVQCSCGGRLQAPEQQAGRKARCPSCQGLVVVPGELVEADSYVVEQVRKCPRCKSEWPTDTVVCVECGHNFETGRRLRTRYETVDRVIDVGLVWLGCYTRYSVRRSTRGKALLTISHRLFFLPLGTATYDLSAYRYIFTDFMAGDRESSDQFYLELQGPGQRDVNIFSSPDEQAMKELVDLVAKAGRLEIKRK